MPLGLYDAPVFNRSRLAYCAVNRAYPVVVIVVQRACIGFKCAGKKSIQAVVIVLVCDLGFCQVYSMQLCVCANRQVFEGFPANPRKLEDAP
mgnify:CR=1 FL=1